MVVLEHGAAEMDFARSVEAAVSTDGRSFQPVYVGIGTRRVTILLLPSPTLARHLRVRAVRAADRPWSLAEIYVQ
jgi:hypothetical protein